MYVLLAIATCILAHPFGLEFDHDSDNSYGHHGKPANYKTYEGIIHPWSDKSGKNKIIMDPKDELMNMWFDNMLNEMINIDDKKKRNEEDDEEAMLAIMQSTPEMCPLCSKEGHSLGHEEHKMFLAKLREKLFGEDKKKEVKEMIDDTMMSCTMCQAEGHKHNHKKHEELMESMKTCPMCKAEGHNMNHKVHMKQKMEMEEDSCPLCKAEGSTMNHDAHNIILNLAKEMELPGLKELAEKENSFTCKLCKHEGTDKNHKKHLEMAEGLKIKSIADKLASMKLVNKQQDYRNGLKKMLDMFDEQRDIMIATIAESQMKKDRKHRIFVEPKIVEFSLDFDLGFDSDEDSFGLDLGIHDFDWGMESLTMPFAEMSASKMPTRDFHLYDDDEDKDGEDTDDSLWDRILKNIRDLFGFNTAGKDKQGKEGGFDELGGIIAMLLLLFVGLLLVSFGLVELITVIFGEEKLNYERLDAEDRIILGMDHVDRMEHMESGIMTDKGSIAI